jgi:hypothetical protein
MVSPGDFAQALPSCRGDRGDVHQDDGCEQSGLKRPGFVLSWVGGVDRKDETADSLADVREGNADSVDFRERIGMSGKNLMRD